MDQDERFKHIVTDPKFRRIPKAERKVKIDKRFQSMFKDDKFKIKYTIDKRGRPVNHTSTEDLKRYYELSSEDESSESEDKSDEESSKSETEDKSGEESSKSETEEAGKFVKIQKTNLKTKSKNNNASISDKVKTKLKDLRVDYARGEGVLVSESSSDDCSESEVEDDEIDAVDHGWGELDKDADKTDQITNRLAVCNQDWDRIRATDLMVLFNSFLPPGGVINSITIYPSDFGLERMKQEDSTGPIELVESNQQTTNDSEEETEEGAKYHMEKLRQYQLNRLKYYYAVVVCDCAETANKIYTECDGLEYESSATKIDLRFIPDGTEFENEPKEQCANMPEKYQPRFFTTTALQQAKVELTWDETDPERLEIAKKFSDGKIDDVTETDLQAYLASSSGEETDEDPDTNSAQEEDNEDETKTPIDKYRALLQDIEKNEQEKDNKGIEMEVTWGLNIKEKSEKLLKKKLIESEDKTPFQQFLLKRKEKQKAKREERKKLRNKTDSNSESSDDDEDDDIPSDIDMNDPYFAEEFAKSEFKKPKKSKSTPKDETNKVDQSNAELELLLLNENDENKKHFNMKKIQDQEKMSKKKRNKKKRNVEEAGETIDDFDLDVKDDRFSALYSSHHFNIDPTDPRFRKTRAMEALIEEKLKRRRNDDEDGSPGEESRKKKILVKPKKDAELSVLVKSVKRKTLAYKTKK